MCSNDSYSEIAVTHFLMDLSTQSETVVDLLIREIPSLTCTWYHVYQMICIKKLRKYSCPDTEQLKDLFLNKLHNLQLDLSEVNA